MHRSNLSKDSGSIGQSGLLVLKKFNRDFKVDEGGC